MLKDNKDAPDIFRTIHSPDKINPFEGLNLDEICVPPQNQDPPPFAYNNVMASNNWKEKRHFSRTSLGWPAALINGQGAIIHGRVRDISSSGALVHISTKLKVDDQIGLAIDIPEFKDAISAKGTIIRVNILDEETSSPTYELGIHFTKMSSRGLEYFSGNLSLGWRKPVIEDKDRQEKPNIFGQLNENSESTSKPLQWVVGGTAVGVLVLIAISFFQLVFPNPPVMQHDLLLLSEGISKELRSVREVFQQQATTIIQIENRFARMENSSISPDQLGEILGLLDSQSQRLHQIESTFQNKPEIRKEVPVDTLSRKESSTKEASTYHTVRHGETIFSISRQYDLTVEELLKCNSLSKGTIIFSNQKLRITPISSNVES